MKYAAVEAGQLVLVDHNAAANYLQSTELFAGATSPACFGFLRSRMAVLSGRGLCDVRCEHQVSDTSCGISCNLSQVLIKAAVS